MRVRVGDRGEDALAWMAAREAKHALDQTNGADATCGECGVGPVLRKNLRGNWFQHVVMMQAAETGMGNDAMSGW
jgi:hypothetical protein